MSDDARDHFPSDDELLDVILLRDESPEARQRARDAFTTLYVRYGRRLLAYLSSRVPRCDLEEVHQEVWLRVWQRPPPRLEGTELIVWLIRVSRNYLIDRSCKRRPLPLDEADRLPSPSEGGPPEQLIERERMVAFERCLQELDDESAAVVLGRLRGEDYEEICGRTGLGRQRAHTLLFKAKKKLQECLEKGLA